MDSLDLTPRMHVSRWRNKMLMFPVELVQPLAWRRCKYLGNCRAKKNREAKCYCGRNGCCLAHDMSSWFTALYADEWAMRQARSMM